MKRNLQTNDLYTKFRLSRKNSKINPNITTHNDNQWLVELAKMGNIESAYDGVRYLLVLVDNSR